MDDQITDQLNDLSVTESSQGRLYVRNLSFQTTWQGLKDHMSSVGDVAYADVMKNYDGRSKGCGIVEFTNAADANKALETLQNSLLDGRNIFIREDRERPNPKKKTSQFSNSNPSRSDARSWTENKSGNSGNRSYNQNTSTNNNNYGNSNYNKTNNKKTVNSFDNDNSNANDNYQQSSNAENDGSNRPNNANRPDYTGRKVFIGNLPYQTTWQELKEIFGICGEVERADVNKNKGGGSKGSGTVIFTFQESAQKAVETLNGSAVGNRTIFVKEYTFNREQ